MEIPLVDYTLNSSDIQEMLSSLILADMPYDLRLKVTQGASIIPDFEPSKETLTNYDALISTIGSMFNIRFEPSANGTLDNWASTVANLWDQSDRHITFFTSGTTGKPKPSTHDIQLHIQEVQALAELFPDRKRIVSFVPRHHIYGFLFSILLPKVMEVPVQWEAPLPTPGLVDALKPGDLMVAFPLLWDKLKEMDLSFGPGVHGVTSTGPCPAETIIKLRGNGLLRMSEIYGSSETGGVGFRHDPSHGYSLLSHWRRTPNNGILERKFPSKGWCEYSLQDSLSWNDESFVPMRRKDNAVQVAGVNVSPKNVREILLEHPKVTDCAVRLMRPEEGDRLKVILVATEQGLTKSDEAEIRIWAKTKLTPTEMPGKWTFTRALPKNDMGKLKDW